MDYLRQQRTALFTTMIILASSTPAYSQQPIEQDTGIVRAEFRKSAAKDSRSDWLRKSGVRVRSIDPANDDYSDLMPIAKAIGSARVVMLGEQSHGEGSTFLAKARLVRFLHAKLGFSVLAIETPMYDAAKAWRAMQQGMDADSAFRRSVFSVWTNTAQFRPVIDYIGSNVRSDRPLVLTGFDSQQYLRFSRDSLIIDLQRVALRLQTSVEQFEPNAPFRQQLSNLIARRAPNATFIDSLDLFVKAIDSAAAKLHLSDSLALMRQVLANIPQFARQRRADIEADSARLDMAKPALWTLSGGIRDRQMARNVLWLAQTHFPKEKIIVWAANGHTRYRDPAAEDPVRASDFNSVTRKTAMGEWLHLWLGDGLYSIMFTSYDGVAGSPTWRQPYVLEVHSGDVGRGEVDFEDLMTAAGFEYGFVDLRSGRGQRDWRHQPFLARPISHVPMKARWPDITDALFFVRTVHPASARTQ